MILKISGACIFRKTAKEVWNNYKENYSKVDNATQIYEIRMKIATVKQGGWSISEQNLWLELDHYEHFEVKCTTGATLLKIHMEKVIIYKLLTCLNNEFDLIRI